MNVYKNDFDNVSRSESQANHAQRFSKTTVLLICGAVVGLILLFVIAWPNADKQRTKEFEAVFYYVDQCWTDVVEESWQCDFFTDSDGDNVVDDIKCVGEPTYDLRKSDSLIRPHYEGFIEVKVNVENEGDTKIVTYTAYFVYYDHIGSWDCERVVASSGKKSVVCDDDPLSEFLRWCFMILEYAGPDAY